MNTTRQGYDQSETVSGRTLDQRVHPSHPLREIRAIADQTLNDLSERFEPLFPKEGSLSISLEKLLRAQLIQMLYSVRSDALLMDQIDYSLLFRWFVGMDLDERIWDVTEFTKCRDCLLQRGVAHQFLSEVLTQARQKDLTSDERFTLDGTSIEAWATMKLAQHKGQKTTPPDYVSRPKHKSPVRDIPQCLAESRKPFYQSTIVAGVVYALLILLIWGAFSLRSGLGYETAFPYNSETKSAWDGFFYEADPLRIHTSTFYHLSYLIAKVLAIDGSYVPYQVVYAVLWWARSFLVFLLVRRFFPGWLAVSYVAGALVAVHASDGALQWVGQMNQFGFIFWMLLACYFLTLAFDSSSQALTAALTIAACFFEYMSLWSYESQIFLLVAFPVTLLIHSRRRRRIAMLSAAWYSIPALYVIQTAARYAQSHGHTYQESVMRKSWSLVGLISDWYFNIAASLAFWQWHSNDWKAPQSHALLFSAVAVLIFVLGGVAVIYLTRKSCWQDAFVGANRLWWALLGVGLVCLALSFPVYLLLDSARSLWRTQLLSGIGSALVLTSVVGLLCHLITWPAAKYALFLFLAAIIVCFGSVAAIQKGAFHRWKWEQHRAVILEVLRAAPSVKEKSIIVLTNVPKRNDPFGDSMWFDLALRLIYPGVEVAGIFFYDDGTAAPGPHFKVEGERWKWDGSGFPPLLRDTLIANTIVIEHGKGGIAKAMPTFICRANCPTELYVPAAVISGPMSPLAIRRYRP